MPTKATGFSDAEKAAAKARVQELKAQAGGPDRDAGLADVMAKIDGMPEPDRSMAKRVHLLISQLAPELWPKTYYGMPGFATEGKNGKMVCWFKPKSKFKVRYGTLEFGYDTKLDDGQMWPVSFALTELTPQTEARIKDLVKQAIG